MASINNPSYSHQIVIMFLIAWNISIPVWSNNELPSETYSVSMISGNEGLPTEEIRKVFKGSNGYMWFATPEGLIRYDGYELKLYSTSKYLTQGLITNNFSDIVQTTDGTLWFATDHGVARLDENNETFSFFNTNKKNWKSQSYNKINTLATDAEDNIWIGTGGGGVLKLNTKNNHFEEFNKNDSRIDMSSEWIVKIYCDSQGNTWITTWEGNLIIINEKKRIYKTIQGITNNLLFSEHTPYSIHETSNNKYWLGLWGKGLVCVSLAQDYQLNLEHKLNNLNNNNIIYDIDIDKKGNLWLGTTNGVIQVQKPQSASPEVVLIKNIDSEPSHNLQYEVFSILCDNNNFIWAGTLTGVYLTNPFSQNFYTYIIPLETNKLLSQAATAITIDPQGHFLIGLRGYGFGEYSFTDNCFIPYTSHPTYNKLNPALNTINCFLWDSDGYLWLGTRYLGLIKYDPKTGHSIEINQDNHVFNFNAETVVDLLQDHLGNIWAGTEKGIYKIIKHYPIKLENFSIVSYTHEEDNPHSISSDLISKIIEDDNKQLWIATFDKGINKLKTRLETHYPVQFENLNSSTSKLFKTSSQISTMYKGSDGTIWIGTTGGKLLRKKMNNNNFKLVKEVDNIIGETIFSIIEDNDHFLWVASSKGLVRIDLNKESISYSIFPKSTELLNNNFIRNAIYKDTNGKLYLGGNKGFNAFFPHSIVPNPSIPHVAITNIKQGNQTIKMPTNNNPLILNHTNNTLSFAFSALSYASPENNQYAIMLEGVDDDWRYIKASIREITYANLKPGEYTLKYNASNNNGLWRAEARQLRIRVNPAYYETWWAITLYFMIILSSLLYIILKERKTNKIMRALEIEHIEHEKSENLLSFKKQLFANISNEFITPLNVLNVYIENWRNIHTSPPQQDLLLAQRNINRLIRFNKQFLYYSAADTEKIELNIKMEKLDLFTSNVCENFSLLMNKKKIQFSKDIQLNQNETWFDTDKLDIILYNLLSLALKDTAQKGSINIQAYSTIRDHEDYATFKITHTYLALSDLTHELTHDKIEHLSGNINIGLAITKQMIELHRGQLEFSTSKNERSISFKIPTSYKAYQDLNPVISNNTQENINYLKNKLEIEEEVLVNLKNLSKETDKKSTIIIIDPDYDLRRILKQQLSTFFSIKEFSNAQTGLKNIFKLSPDLIICDTFASQPFTGMDLCKEIKKSLSHSLTPVIILSGQPSESERALCYKAGTDSYIAKPIDINTLLIRVQNLIKQKIATLKSVPTPINRFTKTINKGKDIFLNEIKTTVEKNISDPHFGVNDLAKELNISKSMLYRKLTNSINLSPNLFIKKIRLLRAIQLLEETTLNISEIAEQCGFNDISYFGHTFKKEYGISPSSYRQNFHKYSNRNG